MSDNMMPELTLNPTEAAQELSLIHISEPTRH